MNSLYEIEIILRDDWLVQVCSLHWSICITYVDKHKDACILPNVFIKDLCIRIAESFNKTELTKDEILYLAHWHSAIMIREQYSKIINKK